MPMFMAWNSAMPTTAARAGVLTGTAIKTMLQVATSSADALKVVRWGVRFETAPTVPVRCELVDTFAVPATTLTAHVAAGVTPVDDPLGPASAVSLGTGLTGWGSAGAGAEGTITATRAADEWVAPIGVSWYDYEFSQGREFYLPVSRFLRVRMTSSVTISAQSYVVWLE